MNNKLKVSKALGILKKAIAISIKTKGKWSIFISLLGLLMAFLPVSISLVLKIFTDEIQNLSTNDISRPNAVLISFATLALLYLLQALFTFTQNYYSNEDTVNVQHYIKEHIIGCMCTVEYKYIDNYENFHEKIQFAKTDAGKRVAGSIGTIFIWLSNLITFVTMAVVLSGVSIWIVIVLITTCIPAVILSYLQKDEDYRRRTKWMKEGRLAIHYSDECRSNHCMNEIRFFGLYPFLKEKWRALTKTYINAKNKLTQKHVLYNSLADILRNSVFVVVLLIAAYKLYLNPSIGLGVFMLVLILSSQLQGVISKLLIGGANFANDIHYMNDFFSLDNLDYEAEHKDSLPLKDVDICFEGVDFSYPDTERKVLKDINITIKQGEKIAIVGENGSGKSTFVNLLCGMYKPSSGEIIFNSENIYANLTEARRSISTVFQNFTKYEATLRENINISDPFSKASDGDIMEMLKLTSAYDIICSQPSGLDEVVGSFSDVGNNLSGGQWQKIAITRTIYRSNARIMVLDEPTAALDPIAEADLYRNFAEISDDRTTILISHRLGITSIVDRILVFESGQIIEDGTHKDLLAKSGVYAKMYQAQAQWYVD